MTYSYSLHIRVSTLIIASKWQGILQLSQSRRQVASSALLLRQGFAPIWSLRYVVWIQTSLNSCNRSQRQSSVAATKSCRSDNYFHVTQGDLLQQPVAATCHSDFRHRVSQPLTSHTSIVRMGPTVYRPSPRNFRRLNLGRFGDTSLLYPATSWFLLRQTRKKPLRATVCFSIEHARVHYAPHDTFDVNFTCQFRLEYCWLPVPGRHENFTGLLICIIGQTTVISFHSSNITFL